ncbi:hypothetical protein GSI_12790 [Ganoderma sinense ZZ0214-1]|uniref:Uncharacterized protein n=1 Tax=Ganoderma sinense ZZ0214-1 TaxID=1077348 RepID=A0A2G8RTS9_9APHY|nr:hypothetical protein GSI_12790 [Ganoderma sinense ZZ0214-1]
MPTRELPSGPQGKGSARGEYSSRRSRSPSRGSRSTSTSTNVCACLACPALGTILRPHRKGTTRHPLLLPLGVLPVEMRLEPPRTGLGLPRAKARTACRTRGPA